jgi:hypothetical protein
MRILIVALLVVFGLLARVPQSVHPDQAAQLRALQQYVAGRSPSLNTVIEPDLRDLSRDRAIWIVSRPPGPQLAAYVWRAAGFSLGTAVRIVAILCLIAGTVGWFRWYGQFDMPKSVRYGVAAALPFLHQASNSLYLFTQDTLSFAAAPWILLLALWLARRRDTASLGAWCIVGLALGSTYVIKYSLFFLGFGAAVWLATRSRPHRARLVALAIGCAIPIAALSVLNARFGPAVNSVTAQAGFYPRWGSLVALIADPALAVGDGEGLIRTILQTGAQYVPAYIGAPVGVAFLWLIAVGVRTPAARSLDAARLGVAVFVATLVFMAAVWTFSEFAADAGARHFVPASLAVIPVAAFGAMDLWRHRQWPVRAIIGCTGAAIVVVPLLYGALGLVAKARRAPSAYRLGPSGLFNLQLAPWPGAPDDLASIERRLVDQFGPTTDLWYCDDPATPLDLPGRVYGDVDERYLAARFQTSVPLRVTALIQRKDEAHGGGAAIRGQFQGAGPWTQTVIPGAEVNVWTTVLAPTLPPRHR